MMGHGKHCQCMVCSMGKAVGMIPECTDTHCTHPSHTNEKKETKQDDNDAKKE